MVWPLMLHDLKIRLTSPILGDIQPPAPSATSIFRLRRGTKNGIVNDVGLWHYALGEAVKSLRLETLHPDCIRMPDEYRAPSLGIYNRRYQHPVLKHKWAQQFEAISSGAVITIPIEILANQSTGEMPSEDEVRLAFSWVGKWIGVTQWGHEFNFGRFNLISLLPTPQHVPSVS